MDRAAGGGRGARPLRGDDVAEAPAEALDGLGRAGPGGSEAPARRGGARGAGQASYPEIHLTTSFQLTVRIRPRSNEQ